MEFYADLYSERDLLTAAPQMLLLIWGLALTPTVALPDKSGTVCSNCERYAEQMVIECPFGWYIRITEAFKGREAADTCPGPVGDELPCISDTFEGLARSKCDGQRVGFGDASVRTLSLFLSVTLLMLNPALPTAMLLCAL